MLNIEAIPAFNDNYIWLLRDDATHRAFVVDPGDAGPVIDTLRSQRLTLSGILVTHHHFDHTGGLERLCAEYQPMVYGPVNPAIAGITRRLKAGDSLDVLGLSFDVLEVPGHTLDHIAFVHRGEPPMVFCGDTLFAGGCGRLFEGNPTMMLASLESLARLPTQTRVYCAHEYTLSNLRFAQAVEPGNADLLERIADAEATRQRGEATVPSTIALELATNPFLRCNTAQLREAVEREGLLHGEETVDVFAAVRRWKDNF